MAQEKKAETDKLIVRSPKEWPGRLRATLVVLALVMSIAALIVILKNDLVNKKIEETKNIVLDYIGTRGFALEDIVVIGRGRTTKAELNKALNLNRGDNLLKINVNVLKQNLEQLPWVRDVRVSRSFFPNVLKIEMSEKQVMAIWQLNERFYPVDFNGYVIEADYRPTKPILLIVGKGAAENILSLLKIIENIDSSYISRIKVANYISNRRWNIILDDIRNGITIKLPEDNVDQAWKKLMALDKEKGILKRKLTIIDLRLENKVTVKLRKSKVKRVQKESNT